jgi:hypothetical protein
MVGGSIILSTDIAPCRIARRITQYIIGAAHSKDIIVNISNQTIPDREK